MQTPDLDDITAKALAQWKVSIPVVPKKDRKEISLADIPSKEELNETDDVSDVFKDIPPTLLAQICSIEHLSIFFFLHLPGIHRTRP